MTFVLVQGKVRGKWHLFSVCSGPGIFPGKTPGKMAPVKSATVVKHIRGNLEDLCQKLHKGMSRLRGVQLIHL